jgi:ubiquinone/menaquinone biosynthesis C-methylase UbiE
MSRPPADAADPRHHAEMRREAREHFDHWALRYDRSWLNELVFFPTIRACQEETARWLDDTGRTSFRLLDVGCGTGTLITLLAKWPEAEQLVGLDYSPAMLGFLSGKIADSPYGAKMHAVQADSERLPFADASFDLITCCNSFHHYPHQAAVVRGFRRVLRPGGRLILIDGFRDNVIGWLIFDVAVAWVEGCVHHAAWSHVRDMMHTAGFSILRQRKMNILAPLLVSVAETGEHVGT